MLVFHPFPHSPRGQDSKIPRFEHWNLGNLGGNLAQKAFTWANALCYIGSKPRGPVRKNTTSKAFATPNDKRGFVMPKFLGLVRLRASVQWLRGMVGATRKGVRTALDVFLTTMLHPLRLRTQTVVFLNPKGPKTMTAITQQASRCAVPTLPTTGTSDLIQLHAEAHNALAMALHYLRTPEANVAGARRKAVQALAALRHLEA